MILAILPSLERENGNGNDDFFAGGGFLGGGDWAG